MIENPADRERVEAGAARATDLADYALILQQHSADSPEARAFKETHPDKSFQAMAAGMDKVDARRRSTGGSVDAIGDTTESSSSPVSQSPEGEAVV